MASTGEVACFGASKEEAFLKALLSTGFKMPEKNILVSVQADLQDEFTHCAYQLHELGYKLFATRATAEVLKKNRVPCTVVAYATEEGSKDPSAKEMIRNKEIGLVINVPTHNSKHLDDNYQMRRTAVDFGVPLLTNMNLVKMFTSSIHKHKKEGLVGLEAHTLFDHYEQETDQDAWTSPDEFH
jgi:carbamoyl-phosphate synthase (ammonia)